MTIFLVLALYLFFVRYVCGARHRLQETILCSLGFVLVLALRSPYCGCDVLGGTGGFHYTSYYGAFINVRDYSFLDIFFRTDSDYLIFDTGYLIYTKLFTLFSNDFQFFLAITALLQFIPIAFFFYKYSLNITLSYFIYGGLGFYSFYFSGLRQAMAISMVLIAIHFIIQNKKLLALLVILIAMTFHRSALFSLLILFGYRVKLTQNRAIIFVVIVLILIPILVPLLMWVSQTFLGGRFSSYLVEESSAVTMFVVYIVLFFMSYIYKGNSLELNWFRWIVFLGVFFQSFGTINNGAITRAGFYDLIVLSVLLPYEVYAFKDMTERKVLTVAVEFMLCVFFVLTIEGPRQVVPYSFFWERPM